MTSAVCTTTFDTPLERAPSNNALAICSAVSMIQPSTYGTVYQDGSTTAPDS